MIEIPRRSFLLGAAASFLAPPAVVRAATLMPGRGLPVVPADTIVQNWTLHRQARMICRMPPGYELFDSSGDRLFACSYYGDAAGDSSVPVTLEVTRKADGRFRFSPNLEAWFRRPDGSPYLSKDGIIYEASA